MDDLGVDVAIRLLLGLPYLLLAGIKFKQYSLPEDGQIQEGNREPESQMPVRD